MRSHLVLLSVLLAILLTACLGQNEAVVAPTPRPLQTAPPAVATPAPTPEAVAEAPAASEDGPVAERAPVAGRSDIDVKALKERIDGGSDVILLDVRMKRDYVVGHIAGSKAVPSHELASRLEELRAFKDREVHVICGIGARSRGVVDHLLQQQGFRSVVNVEGGVKAWTRAGYPVVTGE